MNGRNNLIVIENGWLHDYPLDDKLVWKIGRPSKGNLPDIKMYSSTVSRRHGTFQNMDGSWFYVDNYGKNGTVYNGKHIKAGLNGRVKPIMLAEGDVLIFGGGEEAVINAQTIWAMFSTHYFEEGWRAEETKGRAVFTFTDGEWSTQMETPAKGTVVESKDGLAICMGDVTYMAGNISLKRQRGELC
ncbi:MAG: FHA domain-containing protein [Clostridium sp.]|nr:FHA domain-containing protein [Clostridium sp.]